MATEFYITVPDDQPHKIDVISRFNDKPDGTVGAVIESIIIDPGESFKLVVNNEALTVGVQVCIKERIE